MAAAGRGYWREDGKRRATATYERKGEAREALNNEFDRIRLGTAYRAPITLRELSERFLDQYSPSPRTAYYVKLRLKRPLDRFGAAQAGDLQTETLQRFLNEMPVGKAFRRDIMRALRMVYAFGADAGLVTTNPARKLKAPAQVRSEKITPFESWAEVERVAEECGRWGPMVLFMADTGARPAEAVRLEHRNVDGSVVELPGSKTEHAWRTVHMTPRGIAAIESMPRALATRNVFHIDGRPISWVYFWREVWRPALELAELAYRPPYNLRHTFAYWSLRAGVPIATWRGRWAIPAPSRRSRSTAAGAARWVRTRLRCGRRGQKSRLVAPLRHQAPSNAPSHAAVRFLPGALFRQPPHWTRACSNDRREPSRKRLSRLPPMRTHTTLILALLIAGGCNGGSGGGAESPLNAHKLTAATSVHLALTLTTPPLHMPNAIRRESFDGWLGRSDTGRFRYDYRETAELPTSTPGKPFRLSGQGRSSGGKYAFRIGWLYQNWVCDPAPDLDPKLVAEPLVPIGELHSGAMPSATLATWFDDLSRRLDTSAVEPVRHAPPGSVTIETAGGYPTTVTAEFTARTATGLGTKPLPPERFTAELRLDHWNAPFATPRPASPRDPGILDETNGTGSPGAHECT